jgi:Fuc2NAc and GlcNAc transferase
MAHTAAVVITLTVASAISSWLLTKSVRNHAVARAILDLPNHRSLHKNPTPRGGGLAIVSVVLAFLCIAPGATLLHWRIAVGIGFAGLAIAFVGWRDDVSSISALKRLAVHFAAAIWAVAWLGGFRSTSLDARTFELGAVGSAIAVVGVVWTTNLFNFMDGSDGIVAVEVISIGAIGGSLLLDVGNVGLGTLAFVLAGATLGFAWWNWAPAKIFLGDVGSGFVGFLVAALAVASENAHALPVAVWAVLSCVFLVDATVTLFRRLRRGHWREPHRTHAYQLAIQGGLSHDAVAKTVTVVNAVLGMLAIGWIAQVIPLAVALSVALLVCASVYAVVMVRHLRKEVGEPSTPPA